MARNRELKGTGVAHCLLLGKPYLQDAFGDITKRFLRGPVDTKIEFVRSPLARRIPLVTRQGSQTSLCHSESDRSSDWRITDAENVECFFRDRFPPARDLEIHTLTIPAREVLINVLEQFEEGRKSGKHDITHVAFDPVGQPIVPRTTFAEFIECLRTEHSQ